MSNDTFFQVLIAIKRKGYLAASSLSGKAVGKILSEVERPAEHYQLDTFPSIK